jgi:hypothetical protein
LIVDPACRAAVELAEGVADGQVKRKGQRRAFQAANKEAQTRHRLDQSGYLDADPRGSSLAALAATAAIATRLRVAYDDLEDRRRTVPSWQWAGWASQWAGWASADDTSDSWSILPGEHPPYWPWPRPPTTTAPFPPAPSNPTASPYWPTLSKRLAAPTPTSWGTYAGQARTCADAISWTYCLTRPEITKGCSSSPPRFLAGGCTLAKLPEGGGRHWPAVPWVARCR